MNTGRGTGNARRKTRVQPAQSPEAFLRSMTLVELLFALGMVALLGALLYPALRRSRRMADTAACLSNLHQIGIAVQAYLNDSNGLMPSLQNRDSVTNAAPAMDTILLTGTAARVFRCPADRNQIFEMTGSSYFWNFTVNDQDIGRLFSIVGGSDPTYIPLVSDKEGFHPDAQNRINILYTDGRASKELRFSTSLPPP